MTTHRIAGRARGFTLIELMVALVLGLIVSGAALAVFVTNRQTYSATESLGRIQENARTAFELMGRDLREGAGNACGRVGPNKMSMTNVVNNASSQWYTDWTAGIQGFDGATATPGLAFGTGNQARVAGTDAIDLRSATSANINVVPDLSGGSAEIKIANNTLALTTGDIVAVCDPAHMAVFQVTGYNASNVTVGHNTGNANPSPGNSNKELGTPLGTVYNFGCSNGKDTFGDCATNPAHQWPASIAKMEASRWYIGFNDHGTRSLFHVSLTNSGGVAGTRTDEIAEGVRDMQLQYLLDGAVDYVDASALPAAAWTGAGITAVRIALTVDDDQKLGTDGNALKRELEHTVTLRNRTP